MNKEDAQKCIQVGVQALKKAEFDKAIRMFEKSLRLHYSDEAKAYLDLANEKKQKSNTAPEETKTQTEPKTKNYTPVQEQLVKDILSKKNYYEILGVLKDAKTEQIKKVYKKLALKLHPDKNLAPRADEAFKLVNKAFSCLVDEQKRTMYDRTGSEETPQMQSRDFDSMFAEQVFREFFGESFFFERHPMSRVYRTRRQAHREEPNRQAWPFIQLLPLIFLFLVSALSSYSFGSYDFSLHPTAKHTLQLHTSDFQIPYWIEPKTYRSLDSSEIRKLEGDVLSYYVKNLKLECTKQQNKRQTFINKARYYQGNTAKTYRDYAEKVDMSSCYKLNEMLAS